jgi:EPS-associated MarR family transcriptional regulator
MINYKEIYLHILRKIQKKPELSQRELAKELGFSLGKLNYCLKELKKKGHIKIKSFKKNPKKINYLYILTPKGLTEKTNLTINFMKRKMEEYDQLKKEIDEQNEK